MPGKPDCSYCPKALRCVAEGRTPTQVLIGDSKDFVAARLDQVELMTRASTWWEYISTTERDKVLSVAFLLRAIHPCPEVVYAVS